MGDLLSYSGLTTKVKAMESHLVTDSQFRDMAALETVSAAVDYLRRLPAYEGLFDNMDELSLHRSAIEQRLTLSLYEDFAKLYRFADLNQRTVLNMYFMHLEIDILKKCFRNVYGHHQLEIDLSAFQDFFNKHSHLNLEKLEAAGNIREFIAALEGSVYYEPLIHLDDMENPTLFDYEILLDRLYFKTIWKAMDRNLDHKEKEIFIQSFGSRIDLMNLQWIYRSKKYYNLPPADIYSLLIPLNYHLNKEQTAKLAEAASLDEFFTVLKTTRYGHERYIDTTDQVNLERLTQEVLERIYHSAIQKNPYSIAAPNSYLYFKETEIHKIITLIESIRYRVSPEDILSNVVKLSYTP